MGHTVGLTIEFPITQAQSIDLNRNGFGPLQYLRFEMLMNKRALRVRRLGLIEIDQHPPTFCVRQWVEGIERGVRLVPQRLKQHFQGAQG